MRIISEFHDYYDCIQGAGQDQSLIYLRKSEDVEIAEYPFPLHKRRGGWAKLPAERLVVGFCGKLYPLVRIPQYQTADCKPVFCYNPDEVLAWVNATMHKKEVAAYTKPLPKRRTWRKECWPASTRVSIEKFFEEIEAVRDKHEELFEKFGAPIFLADSSRARVWRKSVYEIEINPRLEVIEFYRVLDRYTAFQELAMYLGAQAQPEKPIPDVPDKVMVGAKGFNKFSFRKDPTKRKRR